MGGLLDRSRIDGNKMMGCPLEDDNSRRMRRRVKRDYGREMRSALSNEDAIQIVVDAVLESRGEQRDR